MTRRRLLLFGVPLALVAIGVSGWLLYPTTAITRENAAKIQDGMTRRQVEAILGGPPRDETTGPILPEDDSLDGWGLFMLMMEPKKHPTTARQPCYWFSDHVTVMVYFHNDGHMDFHMELAMRRRPENPLELLRRWLRPAKIKPPL